MKDFFRYHKKAAIGLIILLAVIIGVAAAVIASRQPEEIPPETTTIPPTTQATTAPPETTTQEETTTEEETTTAKEIKYAKPKVDFEELWKVNPDCCAYLKIPDIPLEYPIMQSTTQEEDYYLDHTFEGAAGLPGSIYIQWSTSKDFHDYLSVVYGHDMAGGSFFGCLYRYIDPQFFKDHQTLYVYTPEEQLKYRIVGQSTVDDSNIHYYFNARKKSDAKRFWDWIHNGEAENYFDEKYEYKRGDKFIILETCIGPRPNNRRVVVGVLKDIKPYRPKDIPTNPGRTGN